MNILGFLGVELALNTAAFKAGTDKATYAAKQFSGDLKKSFGELAGSFSQLGAQLGASFGPAGGLINGVIQSMGALGAAMKTAGGNVPAIMQITAAVAGLGAGAVAAAAGYAELVKGGAHAIEELDLMSEKTGVGIRDLQTLKAVGEAVNVPLDSMARGFRTFSRALVAGGEGTGKAAVALHNLGVTAKDPYEALLQVADGISKIKDTSLRSADASALFGSRMGQSLLPILERGRSGIQEYSDVVSEFGGVVDKEAVDRMEAWKKSTVELSTAWDGLKISQNGEIPILQSINHEMAVYTSALTKATQHSFWQDLKDMGSIITTEGLAPGGVQEDTSVAEGQAAAAALTKKNEADRHALIAKSNAALMEQNKLLTAGGEAQKRLKDLEQEIAELKGEGEDIDYKSLNADLARLPAMKQAADLEKKRNEAMLNLPRTTKSFVDEQAVTVLKEYGAAIKALGPESAEAARQQEVAAEVQKLVNKQREQGIYGTVEAAAALKKEAAAANDASLANIAFSKSAEASKLLVAFSDRMEESTKKANAAAEAISTIGKAQAALEFGLDKAKDALAAQGVAYQQLLLSSTASEDEKKQAADLLDKNTRLLFADTDALEKNKQAIADKITKEALTKQDQLNEKTAEYLALLGKEPEWMAKAESSARAEAVALGLKADAQQRFVDAKMKGEVTQHDQVAPAEVASKAVNGPKDQIKDIEAQKAAILANAAAWQTDAMSTRAATKELQNLNLKENELKAASGNTMAGMKAGLQQFVLETKTVGQSIQENLVKGLNGMTTALAKTIVEGKNFGMAMRQVGIQIAESFVEMELKRLMAHIMVETGLTASTVTGNAARQTSDRIAASGSILKSAKTAAAKGFDAGMKFPFPVDLVMAPLLAAGAFAGVMAFNAFEQGGIVGDTGMAQLHKNEMVLPAPISEKVQKMADPDSGGSRRSAHVTNNFKISTPDANSFKHSQGQIQAKAHLSASKAARRNGGQK